MHDKQRKKMQRSVRKYEKPLIKNGKYFLQPEQGSSNFKELFARLTAAGAGRPVDKDGCPDGPWTPEDLADAISNIKENRTGIELRAVQVWFQDNDNGISHKNIRWLARVFGCDDPDSVGQWQAELTAAKTRLANERRAKRESASQPQSNPIEFGRLAITSVEMEQSVRWRSKEAKNRSTSTTLKRTLPEWIELMLTGPASVNLNILYWLVFCGLGLMNYIVGTLSVTYSPSAGLEKQVGFIWAPTLTVLPLVALPAFIFFVSNMNTYWRDTGRKICISKSANIRIAQSNDGWHAKVGDFAVSFWAIVFFCVVFVFGFQWVGIYVPAYFSGSANDVQIDRYLVVLERPDVISIPEALVLSGVGYVYTASYIAIFMFGLLFSVIVTLDYEEIATTIGLEGGPADRVEIVIQGQKLLWAVFRIVVFALCMAILIKLQVTYLQSDAREFAIWLRIDAATVFLVTVVKIHGVLARLDCSSVTCPIARSKKTIILMVLVIALLATNLVFTGRFHGFSLVLVASSLATLSVLVGPKLRISEVNNERSELL